MLGSDIFGDEHVSHHFTSKRASKAASLRNGVAEFLMIDIGIYYVRRRR